MENLLHKWFLNCELMWADSVHHSHTHTETAGKQFAAAVGALAATPPGSAVEVHRPRTPPLKSGGLSKLGPGQRNPVPSFLGPPNLVDRDNNPTHSVTMRPATMPMLERLRQNESNLATRLQYEMYSPGSATVEAPGASNRPASRSIVAPLDDATPHAATSSGGGGGPAPDRVAARVHALEHALARKAGEYATLYDEACVLKAANNEMNSTHVNLADRLRREQERRKDADDRGTAAQADRDSLEALLADKVGQVEGLIALVYQLQRSCEQLEVGAAHSTNASLAAANKRAEVLESACRDLKAQLAVAQSSARAPLYTGAAAAAAAGLGPPRAGDSTRIAQLEDQADSLATANRAMVQEHDVQTVVVAQLRQQVASQTSLNSSLAEENRRLAAAAQSTADALVYLESSQQNNGSRLSDELVVARTAAMSASAENADLAYQLEEACIRAALLADQNAGFAKTNTQVSGFSPKHSRSFSRTHTTALPAAPFLPFFCAPSLKSLAGSVGERSIRKDQLSRLATDARTLAFERRSRGADGDELLRGD